MNRPGNANYFQKHSIPVHHINDRFQFSIPNPMSQTCLLQKQFPNCSNHGTFFWLHCCAHRDDGDSLGNDDELVHLICIKRENQSTNQTTQKTKPPPKKAKQKPNKQTNNQNTGDPYEGETVKQTWLSVSEAPGSEHLLRQIVPLNTRMCCSPHSNVFQSTSSNHGTIFFWLQVARVRVPDGSPFKN